MHVELFLSADFHSNNRFSWRTIVQQKSCLLIRTPHFVCLLDLLDQRKLHYNNNCTVATIVLYLNTNTNRKRELQDFTSRTSYRPKVVNTDFISLQLSWHSFSTNYQQIVFTPSLANSCCETHFVFSTFSHINLVNATSHPYVSNYNQELT